MYTQNFQIYLWPIPALNFISSLVITKKGKVNINFERSQCWYFMLHKNMAVTKEFRNSH